jgi:hypothetical protein
MQDTKNGKMSKKTAANVSYLMHSYATQIEMALLAINNPELREKYAKATQSTPEQRLADTAAQMRLSAPNKPEFDIIDPTFAGRMMGVK